MKSLLQYIHEAVSDPTSKNILFDFTGIENADDTIKSLQELSKKSGVPVSVDAQKVTVSFTATTLDAAEPIIDVLQQFIEKEGKSQKRSSDEQYAQKLHRFEDAMQKLDDFKEECATAAETDKAPDPKEEDPEGADGKPLKEGKDNKDGKCPKCGKDKKDCTCDKDDAHKDDVCPKCGKNPCECPKE